MILNTLENSLRNYSFLCLFFTMLLYWVKGSFFSTKKSGTFETGALLVCNLLLVSILIVRWIDSNHFPLSNLYESLIFLSWSLINFLLFLQLKTNELFIGILLTPVILFTTTFATFSLPPEMQKSGSLVPALQSNWLMMHVTIMMLSYAALIVGSLLSFTFLVVNIFVMAEGSQGKWIIKVQAFLNNFKDRIKKTKTPESEMLKPLESNQIFSNGSLSIRAQKNFETLLTSKMPVGNTPSLLPPRGLPSLREGLLRKRSPSVASGTPFDQVLNVFDVKSLPETKLETGRLPSLLDTLSYRTIGIGFPLLTIGILSGAVWANETWGSYWNWDPKETWALITWLIYSIYLHSRIVKGWEGEKPALIASLGFVAVWVCYLGVNIFGKGLHSYGWFQL